LTTASSADSNFGGWIDVVLMRFTDVMMAVPALLFAMALAGLLGVGRTVELPAGLRCRSTSCRLRGPERLAAGAGAGLLEGVGVEAAASQPGWPWLGTWGSSGSDMGRSPRPERRPGQGGGSVWSRWSARAPAGFLPRLATGQAGRRTHLPRSPRFARSPARAASTPLARQEMSIAGRPD
jgi:hypothetical protein